MLTSKTFFLNGNEYCTTANLTIFEIVTYFNYNTLLLVLEYNSQICNKRNWKKFKIKNNDKIEIVTIVGGG